PRPTVSVSPQTSSRVTPTRRSTPACRIGLTTIPSTTALGTFNDTASLIDPNATAADSAESTPNTTPPTSVLWAMSFEDTFKATGAPYSRTMAAASTGVA